MNVAARVLLAMICWAVAAAAGWWWQRPGDAPSAPPAAVAAAAVAARSQQAPLAATMAARVVAADPMGLTRSAGAAIGTAPVALPDAGSITWRVAALVVRGSERFAVMTADNQPPLRLGVGDSLPDGDRIRAIHANRIDIQSPRGRPRTLYLIEP